MSNLRAPEARRGPRGAIARRWSNAALTCEVMLLRAQAALDRCEREAALQRLADREPGAILMQRIAAQQDRCDVLSRDLALHRQVLAGLRAG